MTNFLGSKDKLSPLEASISGACSGVITRAVISPFDVVKIRFQLQSTPTHKRLGGDGLINSVARIVKGEGLKAFWKGHTASQVLSVVYGAVQFGIFAHVSNGMWQLLPEDCQTASIKPLLSFLCGGISGCMASFASMPFDTVRTRMVVQKSPLMYLTTVDALVKICSNEGVTGLYRGLLPNLCQVFPAASIQFGSYSTLVVLRNWISPRDRLSSLESFSFGAISGLISKTATLPFDITKKRLQVQGFRGSCNLPEYTGVVHCITTVYKHEGLLGFYKGAVPSLLKAFLSTGMTFMTYNFFTGLMLWRRERYRDSL